MFSVIFTWCFMFTEYIFIFGLLCGLGMGIIPMIEYFGSFKRKLSSVKLPGLRFITFENTHFITNVIKDKCCGENSQFCGWVFGVCF